MMAARRLAAAGACCGAGAITAAAYLAQNDPLVLARLDASVRAPLAAVLPSSAFVWLYSATRGSFIKALARDGAGGEQGEQGEHCHLGKVTRRDGGECHCLCILSYPHTHLAANRY